MDVAIVSNEVLGNQGLRGGWGLPVEVGGRWFVFEAWGHVNVRATHRSTFEVTREPSLTPRGDCIVGVSSEVGAAGLPRPGCLKARL